MEYRNLLFVGYVLYSLQCRMVECADMKRCLGLFCGRIVPIITTNASSTSVLPCGACPWGFRTDGFICQKCNVSPAFYDWLYLGFMALLVPFLNSHMIEYLHKAGERSWLIHLSVFFEFLAGSVVAVIIMEPYGKFSLTFCGANSVKDWYTIFFNPRPNFIKTVRCTQEAVYPLFSIVLLFYALELVLLMVFRIPVYCFILQQKKVQLKSVYATLYILPILSVMHTGLAGVLYYTFPYILLIVSSLGTAVYLSIHSAEIWTKLRSGKTIFILLMYALAHAYGMIAITQFKLIYRDGPLLLLIFLPSTFYLLTHKLTAPNRFFWY